MCDNFFAASPASMRHTEDVTGPVEVPHQGLWAHRLPVHLHDITNRSPLSIMLEYILACTDILERTTTNVTLLLLHKVLPP